ncbi:MAG: hypothetical protein MI685_09205 [Chlorobiales bacterium]|nr:hypothetical protein [Chlorobiales bacterium]
MTILAYILAFFTIGWGSGIVGLVFMPLIMAAIKSPGSLIHRCANFSVNLVATFIATYAVSFVCSWLNVETVYAMFALPFFAMISNDLKRISAQASSDSNLTDNPDVPEIILGIEVSNLWADIIGFGLAIVLMSPLNLF